MTENDFVSVLEELCKRPMLYTPTGSFFELVSYIEGLALHEVAIPGYLGHSNMRPFLTWVCNQDQNKYKQPFGWKDFREAYTSDDEAFKALPDLYAKYVGFK